jgi:sugar/nucleoside kinase (ribokinase family)
LILSVLEAARQAGAKISLDLASFNVVEQSSDFLHDLVAEYIDILIANEDEAYAYTGKRDPAETLEALKRGVDLAVLKLGPNGSLIGVDSTAAAVQAFGNGRALDTTGAGDLWASGFLYGLVNNRPLQQCGELGSLCGYEVCQVMGAHIPDERWEAIRTKMEAKWPQNV